MGTILKKSKIRRWDIIQVFLRSFFLQSVWNFRSLISVGFSICMLPIIKRLYKNPQDRKTALKRHLKFFNAHPYMASYALGVSIHLEEAYAEGEQDACYKLERIKELLTGILGAIGDQLFWETLKPFSLIMGGCALFLVKTPLETLLVLISVFFIYNTPHIYLRYIGIVEGYKYGLKIYQSFNKEDFKLLRSIYFYIGVIAFILFLTFLIIKLGNHNLIYIVVFVASCLASGASYYYMRNIYLTILLSFSISCIIGIFYIYC